MPTDDRVLSFGPYTADCRRRLLLRDGQPLELTPTAFDLLTALLSDPGRVFSRDELITQVWAGRHVEDGALSHYISLVRRTLDSRTDAYIVTLPRRGYQFVGRVVDQTVIAPRALEIPEPPTRGSAPPVEHGSMHSGSEARRLLVRAANRLGLGATIAAALLIGSSTAAPNAGPKARVVAVLPLQPVDSRDRELGAGIADALARELAKLPELSVRAATLGSGTPEQDPVAVAASLGAEGVLTGTIAARNETVRVALRLLAVPSGQVLWAGSLTRPTTDLAALQEYLAQEASSALGAHLSSGRIPAPSTTAVPAAQQAYMKGRYNSLQVTADSFRRARAYYLEALELDPGFIAARVALASLTQLEGYYGYGDRSSAENYRLAREMIEGILTEHPDEANALDVLGRLQDTADWDIRAAEATYRRAVELAPFEARARQHLAWSLLSLGRLAEAQREMQLAVQVDPSPLRSPTAFAWLALNSGEPARAVDLFRKVLETDPRFARAHLGLGAALEQIGEHSQAERHFELALDLVGDPREALAGLGHLYAVSGRRSLAKATEAELVRLDAQAEERALVAAGLGDIDRALTLVEAAVADRNLAPVDLLDPRFDPLRSHPRWRPLAAAANGTAPVPAYRGLAHIDLQRSPASL